MTNNFEDDEEDDEKPDEIPLWKLFGNFKCLSCGKSFRKSDSEKAGTIPDLCPACFYRRLQSAKAGDIDDIRVNLPYKLDDNDELTLKHEYANRLTQAQLNGEIYRDIKIEQEKPKSGAN